MAQEKSPGDIEKGPIAATPDSSVHDKEAAMTTEIVCNFDDDDIVAEYKLFPGIPWIRRHRVIIFKVAFLLWSTVHWITGLVFHSHDKNWLIPFLIWLCIILRYFFWYVSSKYVSDTIYWVWARTGIAVYDRIPPRLRTPLGALVAIAAVVVGTFVSPENEDNTRANRAISLVGIIIVIFVFWFFSRSRQHVKWRTVIVGMLAQYIIGLFVLRTSVGYNIFKFIADRAADLLECSKSGVSFLTSDDVANLPWFFIGVIPAIIFFISLVQVLFHLGFIQWFVRKIAIFVFWSLEASGAEAVVVAATPFVGQGESAMLVRPFVPYMTNSEIHQILTCGFATISGSVLVGYIGLGLNAEAMVSSCIMSIPASIAISKLRYPELKETLTAGKVVIPEDKEHKAKNGLHAFANGAWLGIQIGGTIIASLICILAVVTLINNLLTWWGHYLNIEEWTLQLSLSYLLWPVTFLLGVNHEKGDVFKNEYKAFSLLSGDPRWADLSPRSQLIATYALCGFGNIGSLGIQIGIISQLAPSRGGDVARLAVSALISGIMATLTSASIAGLVVTDQLSHFVKST
ncbi:Solute carrier family 28 member 3 [Escovopsis weberi]|uniref:Solute carrier family 28 member 3 n=1 Tax=Escovopsis weberi TaxID=150374 RepID=A0A0M9VUU8_ESCWE|nr:Solute carrier family 28 member 3 [Escovopsis weberi]